MKYYPACLMAITARSAQGQQLSHGQPLVCLVRAYLIDPAILILDEATSAIDLYTERRTNAPATADQWPNRAL